MRALARSLSRVESETGLHHAFEYAELQVAFVKIGLGEGDRHEFEHFVERHAEDGDDRLGVGEGAPLMHRDARLYAAQLVAALSLERGA